MINVVLGSLRIFPKYNTKFLCSQERISSFLQLQSITIALVQTLDSSNPGHPNSAPSLCGGILKITALEGKMDACLNFHLHLT